MSEPSTTINAVDRAHETSELHPAEALRTYWLIFYWLMGLLVLTVVAGRINLDKLLPGLNAAVALTIAVAKASLVVLFFMHVKKSSKLTWAFATAAFIWLVILLALTFNDYLTREKIPSAMKVTPDEQRAVTQEREPVTGH